MKKMILLVMLASCVVFLYGNEEKDDVIFSDPTSWPHKIPEKAIVEFEQKKCLQDNDNYLFFRMPLIDCADVSEIRVICRAATTSVPPGRLGILIQSRDQKKLYTTGMKIVTLNAKLNDYSITIKATELRDKKFAGELFFYRFQNKGNIFLESIKIQSTELPQKLLPASVQK